VPESHLQLQHVLNAFKFVCCDSLFVYVGSYDCTEIAIGLKQTMSHLRTQKILTEKRFAFCAATTYTNAWIRIQSSTPC